MVCPLRAPVRVFLKLKIRKMSKPVKKSIQTYYKELCKEQERRENLND